MEDKSQLRHRLVKNLSKFDAYPKTLEDFRIKTFGGASVTIISCTLIVILFVLELNNYLTPVLHEELLVDVSSVKKLTINFDITFLHVSCKHLSLDATDISGEQHINIQHDIFKRRLDTEGQPIESAQKDNSIMAKKSKNITLNGEPVTDKTLSTLDPERCESCYGVEPAIKRCCNTCKDILEAYNTKGWIPEPSKFEQCKREGITQLTKNTEGCQIFGNIEINRIQGNFHISLGQSSEHNHAHVHDINIGDLMTVNTSHTINHLSFGQKLANTHNQLDGTSFISEHGAGLAAFQYYIKIVPTIYQNLRGEEIFTNQFAVNRYKREYSTTFDALTEAKLPGVFFVYEFAPMLVKYTETSRPFLHFLTSICAIVGGILTVAGIVDSFIYNIKTIREKILMGKFL